MKQRMKESYRARSVTLARALAPAVSTLVIPIRRRANFDRLGQRDIVRGKLDKFVISAMPV